ncbi:hypothetical protein L484_007828 [Morus notabilis]|uniref:Uncharacterized protein n=1 Tax=Morus notabilis TaxID=981085 RepID=W9RWC3_9ROSA|nr:hypothetical protein L484_007828 [Morus notabilis]
MFMEDHGLEHGDYVRDYGVSRGELEIGSNTTVDASAHTLALSLSSSSLSTFQTMVSAEAARTVVGIIGSLPVPSINAAGIVIETVYIILFLLFSDKKMRSQSAYSGALWL